MGSLKQVLDMSMGEEMHALCQCYKGLYRVVTSLERLAEGIAMVASRA
jgi:hypothetical protein